MPCFYFGVADTSMHLEWLRKRTIERLTARLLFDQIQLPGVERPVKEIPSDMSIGTLPAPTSLHVLKCEVTGNHSFELDPRFLNSWLLVPFF